MALLTNKTAFGFAEPGPRGRALLFVAVLLTVTVPRLWAWRGVQEAHDLTSYIDMAAHLLLADLVHKRKTLPAVAQEEPNLQRCLDRVGGSIKWPEGTYNISRLWRPLVAHDSAWSVHLTNLLFILILLLGVWRMGFVLGGTTVAVLATLFTGLSPPVIAASWYFSTDLPMTAMTIMGLSMLWRAKVFCHFGSAALFAVWSALGCWTKVPYGLYLAVPAVYALVFALSRVSARGRRVKIIGNAVAALVVFIGVSLALHGDNFSSIFEQFQKHTFDHSLAAGFQFVPLTAGWASAYLWFAACDQPWPLLLLSLPGFVALVRGKDRAARWLLLPFLIGGYVVLTLMANKLSRYALPAYPVLALLAAWWSATQADTIPGIRAVVRRWPQARRGLAPAVALVWLATSLLCQIHPTPWGIGRGGAEEHISPQRFLFEFWMPSGGQLDGLRHNVHHTTCDLRPLMKTMGEIGAAVVRHDTTSLPIWVTMDPQSRLDVVTQNEYLALAVAKQAPDRFVLNVRPIEQCPMGGWMVVAASAHAGAVDRLPRPPLITRQVRVTCKGERPLELEVFAYEIGPEAPTPE